MAADVLRSLDRERRAAGEEAARGGIVRERSPDGSRCAIVYSHCTAEEVDEVIRDEASGAESAGYELEWKVYGHDVPSDLGDRLLAAGFERGAQESVLVLQLSDAALTAFAAPGYRIVRVRNEERLDDVADVAREIGRQDVEEERRRLALALRDTPGELSIHVAYVDGEPVASGRIHFKENSDFAELAGGRTKTTHRNRGLFTALVAARLREALARNRTHVLVDALPTSEPILRKRGFRFVTHTWPHVYRPRRPRARARPAHGAASARRGGRS